MVMLNFKLRRQHMKVIHQLLFSEAFATWYYVWCHVLIVNIDFYIFVSFEFIFLFGGGVNIYLGSGDTGACFRRGMNANAKPQ